MAGAAQDPDILRNRSWRWRIAGSWPWGRLASIRSPRYPGIPNIVGSADSL